MSPKLSKLSGEAEGEYVKTVATALKRARLNRQFPDGRATADHIALMGADCHHGLYDGLELDLRSGLPSYREWVRVQTDSEVLGKGEWEGRPLEELERRAAENKASVFGKQLLQYHYREHLQKKKTVAFDHLDVQLMRVDAKERTAQFRVVMDKLSVAGTFTRTTIELSQTSESWNRDDLRLDGEHVKHTDSFRTLIYSLGHASSEMLFHRLEADEKVRVAEVVRGTIGPIFLPFGLVPTELSPLLESGNCPIASFSLDVASREQKEDRNNDPFSFSGATDGSQNLSSEFLEAARSRHGYRVFRDRKFVTDSASTSKLEAICRDLGTRNLVYKL